jgi:hypothetical protein
MSAGDEPPVSDPELLAYVLKALSHEGPPNIVRQTVTRAEGFGAVVRIDVRNEGDECPMRHVAFRVPAHKAEAGEKFRCVSFIADEAYDLDALRAPPPRDWRRTL